MELIEHELIKRARGGDTGAFKQLVEENQKQVFNRAMELTGNGADADDLAQIVFIKAYKGLSRFKGQAKFQSWLYRIMVNSHIDESRKRLSRGGWEVAPVHRAEGDEKELFIDTSSAHNPEAQSEAASMRADIEIALQALAPQQRTIFVMRHYKDMPLKEIAQALGVTTGTVKSQLFRALQHLQEKLAFYRHELGLGSS
ncbi:MAG: sigma-70 family RNA polymerase sigma factor [Candidatus Marinimicrobia bacterium]|nr:sigma-70 family RNA polymerase sigma factor [Candidatus Neomarinimicrobiota bacterium]